MTLPQQNHYPIFTVYLHVRYMYKTSLTFAIVKSVVSPTLPAAAPGQQPHPRFHPLHVAGGGGVPSSSSPVCRTVSSVVAMISKFA